VGFLDEWKDGWRGLTPEVSALNRRAMQRQILTLIASGGKTVGKGESP
jgi:hypothetical protein